MAPPARVSQIRLRDIQPNPHNPRRLFDTEPMEILKESIEKLGVLVPVTVYQTTRARRLAQRPYTLLDGERRWRCAQSLHRATIPAIVVQEPKEEQNILTMFHIHNVREGWQLMPTALKLKILMVRLNETNERKLEELTQLSKSQIRRCKILLTYPTTFHNLMLAPPSERMKSDFFIELQRIRGPALECRFPPWIRRGDVRCIRILLDKYNTDVIRSVTEFRRLAEIYRASHRLGRDRLFFRALSKFLDTPKMSIEQIHVPGATFAKEAKEIRRTATRLLTQLQAIDLEDIGSDEVTIKLLRRLVAHLTSKLEAALLVGPRDVTGRT